MPLDPDWPAQRLQQLCDEAQPAAVVWAAHACPGGHGRPPISGWPLVQLPGLAELLRQTDEAQVDAQPAAAQQQQQQQQAEVHQAQAHQQARKQQPQPSPACYLLYTSGSTGRPLGVLGTQAGVLNRCRWMEAAHPFQVGACWEKMGQGCQAKGSCRLPVCFGLGAGGGGGKRLVPTSICCLFPAPHPQPGDCVGFKTAPAFVDAVWEVFGPLLAGVPLVAVPHAAGRDAAQVRCRPLCLHVAEGVGARHNSNSAV